METIKVSGKFTLCNGEVEAPVWRRVKQAEGSRQRPYNIYEVLTEYYGQNPDMVLKDYFDREAAGLFQKPEQKGFYRARLIDWWLAGTDSALGQPLNETVVDLIFSCRVAVDRITTTEYPWAYAAEARENPESVSTRVEELPLRLRYILNLQPKNQQCIGPLIGPYEKDAPDPWMDRFHWDANEYLLPILRAEDYDAVANEMLTKYYPEEMAEIRYRDTLHLDPEDLAARMRLKLQEVRFPDPDQLGQLYYSYAEVDRLGEHGERVKQQILPGTILIDVRLREKPEERAGTIVHECSHMYLDRWYFLLQMMTGQPTTVYTNRRRRKGSRSFDKSNPTDWMEYQCDRLPASVMMENVSTKRFADEWMNKTGDSRGPGDVRNLIAALAARSRVSFSMAKRRLIELGVAEAQGIGCYVNGRRVPDYGCTGKWPEEADFTVSLKDAARIMRENEAFEAKVCSGQYIYAEGHFCLNQVKYLWQAPDGQIHLTCYAHTHMEECCVRFRTGRWGQKSNYRFGVVNRTKTTPVKGQYLPGPSLAGEPGTEQYREENKALAKDSHIWGDLLKELKPKFKDALNQILEVKGITREALALELGVDRKTLYQYVRAKHPTVEHVVGICVALKLPYFISYELLTASKNSLRESGKQYDLYREFLIDTENMTVARCEDVLAEEKLPPLFNGERDAAVCPA